MHQIAPFLLILTIDIARRYTVVSKMRFQFQYKVIGQRADIDYIDQASASLTSLTRTTVETARSSHVAYLQSSAFVTST